MLYNTYPESSCELKGCDNIRNYILGGRGVVTLKSPSGVHHSYSFRKPVQKNVFPEGTMFTYCLGEAKSWQYVGMLRNSKFKATRHSHFDIDTPVFKGAKYIVKMMSKDLVTPMRLYHEGVCAVCGRKLTSPKSIQAGIGPRCMKRLAV